MSSWLDQVGKLIGLCVDIYSNLFVGPADRQHWCDWKEKWGRSEGEAWEGQRPTGVRKEMIWSWSSSINLKNCLFDDFMDIFGITHPNSAIDSLWLTQPRAVSHPSSSQVIDQATFHLYSYLFPMMIHCVSFYYSFSPWFIIWFIMALTNAVWGGNFLELSLWLIAEEMLIDLNNVD